MRLRTTIFCLLTLFFFVGANAHPFPKAATSGGAVATFVRSDTATQGTWEGVYGADGNAIANTTPWSVPLYASFTPENQANYTWMSSTGDPRALQVGGSSPTNARDASCWYTYYGNSFDLNLNFTDGNTHQFVLYALDWDNKGRSESIQVVDANSAAVLNTQLVSNFANGIYLIWNISGHVKINVTSITGTNAVISGAFFEPAPSTGNASSNTSGGNGAAKFVSSDTSTAGNWQGTYGGDGYFVANAGQKAPSYATFAVQNQSNFTWSASTLDPRAPQDGIDSGRIAATWFSGSTFDFDVNVTDGNSHPFALYLLDWDSKGRVETLRISDAITGTVLDARSISNFGGGMYLIWSITGHVRVDVTMTGGPNAVVSGAFFGGSSPTTTNTNATNANSTNTNSATVSAPATVTVALPISVSVAPGSVSLGQGQTQALAASVQNSTNSSVSWSINPAVGSISSSGVYTAPATVTTLQTVIVTATSVATPSGLGVATITLTPPASGLAGGLVLHWTFDSANTSGTTETDTSNNGGTGTIAGNPAVVTGKLNQALNFNGVNSYVSMYSYGDKATEFNNSITLAAWINTTNASRPEAIISKFSAAGSGAGYIFRTDAAGHLELAVGAEDLAAYPSTVMDTTTINDGQWHHVVAVLTIGQNVQFFVDGKLTSTSAMHTLANGDGWSNLEVGSSSYTAFANYFTGSIDDVQVYDRALSAAEVNTVFTLAGGVQSQTSVTPTQPIITQSQTVTTNTAPTVTQGQLSSSPASFNFGSVNIGSNASQTFSVSNTGTASVTISNVSVSGPGINASGLGTGTVLAPSQSASLTVFFSPASTGSVAGGVTITSNAANSSFVIGLAGTGAQPVPVAHSIVLTWAASTSAGIIGYDVYRGTAAGGPYTLLTTTPNPSTSYTDSTVQSGQTYYYVVTSIDSANVQSAYSNAVSATVQ